jgi:hypothetical protein
MSTHGCSFVARQVSSAVVLALALIASPGIAQKADRPAVKVGDEWQFTQYMLVPVQKPNLTWVITSVTPTGIAGTENGKPLKLTPDLNVVESPRADHSDWRLLSFPLEVGKKWAYSDDFMQKDTDYAGHHEVNVTVVGHERVRVPAGEFDAYKLEAKIKEGVQGGPPARDVTRTYWYAPAARAVVKYQTTNPSRGPETLELVSFKLQP